MLIVRLHSGCLRCYGDLFIMLCRKCRNMHFRPLKDCPLELQESVGQSPFPSLYYLHSANRACLAQTADSGCHFCKTIQHRLLLERRGIVIQGVSGKQIILELDLTHDDQGLGSPQFSHLTMKTYERNLSWYCKSHFPCKISSSCPTRPS